MNKKVYLAVALIVMVSLACITTKVTTPPVNNGNTGPSALYQDDFSNTNSGWPTSDNNGDTRGYSNGGYRFVVNSSPTDLIANAGASLPADVAIEVDATNNGIDNNDFGVLCRVQDADNFYFFQLASDGYAAIGMYKNNQMQYLSGSAMTTASGINSGHTTNHLRAVCQGNTLSLYANGTLVTTVTDSTFTGGGDVGLTAGTFTESGVDITFDNLVVTNP